MDAKSKDFGVLEEEQGLADAGQLIQEVMWIRPGLCFSLETLSQNLLHQEVDMEIQGCLTGVIVENQVNGKKILRIKPMMKKCLPNFFC